MNASRLLPSALLVLAGVSVWVGKGVDVGPIDLQAVQVATVLLALGVLAAASLSRRAPLTGLHPTVQTLFAALVVAALLVCVAALLSSGAARNDMSVVRFVARYAMGIVLVGALLHFLRRPRSPRVLEAALLTGAVASVGLSALGFAFPALGEVTIRFGDRAQGLVNNPNQLAMMLVATVPIALAAALRAPRRLHRWLLLVALVAGVAFTGSKANLLLLAVGLPTLALLAAFLRRGVMRKARTAFALTALAASSGAAAYWVVLRFNPRTLATFERLLDDPAGTSTVASRREMWESALQTGLAHPWFGVGADHAPFYLPHAHAHNVGIEFFLTMGAVGVAALAALLGAWLALALTSAWVAYTERGAPFAERVSLLAYAASLLAYVASNQTSDSFGGTTLPIAWIVSALALARLDLSLRRRSALGTPHGAARGDALGTPHDTPRGPARAGAG